jgi:transcriptional regulator with XRE-family HTH domain
VTAQSETLRELKLRQHIGATLKRLRKEKRITQASLGVALGLGQTSIVKIETGLQSLSTTQIDTLALFFNVQPNVFFPGYSRDETVRSPLEMALSNLGPEDCERVKCVIEFLQWRNAGRPGNDI